MGPTGPSTNQQVYLTPNPLTLIFFQGDSLLSTLFRTCLPGATRLVAPTPEPSQIFFSPPAAAAHY
eukprot:1072997-Pyramimonas_sp.AAC.1